jgi:hypothetical protein
MKKYTFLFSLFLLLLTAVVYGQDKKVAVVTFFADRQVGLKGTGLEQAAAIANLAKDTDFNLLPMLQDFHQQFMDDYSKNFPFQLIPEQEVFNNPGYKAFYPQRDSVSGFDYRFVPIKGYQVVHYTWGEHNRRDLLKIFSQADGIMFVDISFYFEPGFAINGMGTAKIKAYASIILVNRDDKTVFRITVDEASKKTVAMVGGIPAMEPKKVLPMCESALSELMKGLDKKLPKLIKKSEASL